MTFRSGSCAEGRDIVVAANAPKLVEAFYDRIWNQGDLEAAEQLLSVHGHTRNALALA
jgi:hypothetical protein